MKTRFLNTRRVLAAGLLSLAVAGVTACSRKDAILDPNVTPPGPGGTVTFRNTVSHLLSDRSVSAKPIGCTHCHHAGNVIPDWSDYQTVKDFAPIIKDVLTPGTSNPNATMQEFLLPGEAAVVIAWINAGTPE